MSKKYLLLLGLCTSFTIAASTTIEMEGEKLDCEKSSNGAFHCEKDNRKILVVKNFMGFGAIEKTGSDLPKMKWVSKVVDDNKVLFETPGFPGYGGGNASTGMNGGLGMGFGMGMGGGGSFVMPKFSQTRESRISNAKAIIGNLDKVDDSWAREFIDQSKDYVEKMANAKPDIQIVGYDGKSYACTGSETRKLSKEEESAESLYKIKIRCNFYACTGMAGDKVLGFIPANGAMGTPHFLKLNGTKTQLHVDGFKVIDKASSEDFPLYDLPVMPPYPDFGGLKSDEFDEKLFIPSKYQQNQTAYNYLTNPMIDQTMGAEANLCSGTNDVSKMLEDKKNVSEQMKNDIATTNLSHYLMMTNGQMLSLVIDANKAKNLGCRYDDLILSKEAALHLDYLQKAHPKPVEKYLSITEVQELFTKAKNMSDIPFGYKYDGCYARAHVMARRFEEMGIPTEKVWIKGSLFVPGTDIQWNYHVAPVINVKDKNGEIKKYVIDPSLNDKAVPLDEWVATMGTNVKGGVMKTSYPFPVNIASFQRTAVAISSSDIYVPDNDEKRSEAQNMALALGTMKEYKQALEAGNQ